MSKELYVGSISPKATEEDLIKLFTVAGTVTSVHLIRDNQTGEFKECGYVRMATEEQVKEAINLLDGALLINRVISVSVARPKTTNKPGSGNNRKFSPEKRPSKSKR
ncbi:RNA recognition motif domain-containing protein [Pelotalea chapellei]|uniref:RNA-binding protein n=1 Tax=Pelotalea chapellei TaxID=44671 RepID=A0ABS5UBU2_9BACT|nr:RNA-binding protein [Pelotalea chapellei]MBT1073154.1 RNA-binding protein [Pelotalea chapellei]